MNNGHVYTVSGIDLSLAEPTTLAMKDLQEWVVWQFPRRAAKAHFAAVKPPIADHGWYPATVDKNHKHVTIYANIETALDSPEAASRQLEKLLAL
jgi:hypothetical protein